MHTYANKKSAYIPPSLRGKSTTTQTQQAQKTQQTSHQTQSWSIAKKTALKKEFAIEQSAFPSLGDTVKKQSNRGTPISFSSAAAGANKLVEIPKEVKDEVLPGWVHIRREPKGMMMSGIQYKYGKPIIRENTEEKEDMIRSRIILKNRIDREQYDRNKDIECLGDLSEFYGQPTLVDIYENDLETIYSEDDNSD
jgi:hypothetical protein